jgi:hypothetical protein
VLGEEHPYTLESYHNLGSMLCKEGKHKEGQVFLLQTLSGRQNVLGKKHPDTLLSMYSAALCLKGLSRDQEAYSLMEQCVQIRDEVLGASHPDTQRSLRVLDRWRADNCHKSKEEI